MKSILNNETGPFSKDMLEGKKFTSQVIISRKNIQVIQNLGMRFTKWTECIYHIYQKGQFFESILSIRVISKTHGIKGKAKQNKKLRVSFDHFFVNHRQDLTATK